MIEFTLYRLPITNMKKFPSFFRNRSGFSLAEMLVYLGILGITAGVLTGILSNVTVTQVEESGQTEISGQLNFTVQTIQRLVRGSSVVEMSGTATSTLRLRMPTLSQDPTIISLSNGKIYVQQGSGTAQPITNELVVVDSVEFRKFSQAPAKDVVQIDIAMSSAQPVGGKIISRSLRSAISRASAVVFDSDLLPASDNVYNVGLSPSTRWRDINASGNIVAGGQMNAVGGLCIAGDCKTAWSQISSSQWTTTSTGIFYNGGNVGIGTMSPGAKLVVSDSGNAGEIRTERTGASSSTAMMKSHTGEAIFGSANNVPVSLRVNDSTILRINTNGNVGIGTSTPASPLTVAGAIRSTTGGFIFPDNTTQTTAAKSGGIPGGIQVFTSNGTFTVPSGVTSIWVEVQGGGGGGSAGTSGLPLTGAGGGAGGYAARLITGLTPGAQISVTIGDGGAAGSSLGASGSTGGTTSFGSYLSATGGSGGFYYGYPYITGGASGGSGGVGSDGNINLTGSAGDGAESSGQGTGNTITAISGTGGAGFRGLGAGRGRNYLYNITTYGYECVGGSAGSVNTGAGGAGACAQMANGTAGGSGIVVVWW